MRSVGPGIDGDGEFDGFAEHRLAGVGVVGVNIAGTVGKVERVDVFLAGLPSG